MFWINILKIEHISFAEVSCVWTSVLHSEYEWTIFTLWTIRFQEPEFWLGHVERIVQIKQPPLFHSLFRSGKVWKPTKTIPHPSQQTIDLPCERDAAVVGKAPWRNVSTLKPVNTWSISLEINNILSAEKARKPWDVKETLGVPALPCSATSNPILTGNASELAGN